MTHAQHSEPPGAGPSRRSLVRVGGGLVAAACLPLAAAGTAEASPSSARTAEASPSSADAWNRVPRILASIRPPTFARRTFDITRFGAVGDGTAPATEAIRSAVSACHGAGGGRVLVPAGRFLTGPVHLLSGVELHVSRDATLFFSTDPADYLPVVHTSFEGTECYNYSPLVYAYGQHDVAVTGPGTLDGQGTKGPWESWYTTSGLQSADQKLLRSMGTTGVPVEERVFGAGHYLRPTMVQFYRCENVLVSDLTIVDPPQWTVNPVLCTNVTVRGVTVESLLYNTDGCDPESCDRVLIEGCRFNTNDDCIAVKSGRDEDGRRLGVPSQNIVIRDCDLSGRWGGIAIGSEMSGGVRRVYAERCRVNPPSFPGHYPVKYPLYIKTNKLRGGYVEDVWLRDFTGQGVERDILFFTMAYNGEVGSQPVTVRNINVEHMRIDGAGAVLDLVGLETDPMTGVHLSDCVFTGVASEDSISHVEDLTLRRVKITR